MDGNLYVFLGLNGIGHLQNMKRAWDRIREKAGLPDVRFHDLRRTVGSWLAGSGESLSLIGKVLNHRDVSTTAIYARLNLDPVRQALERNATKMLEAGESSQDPKPRNVSVQYVNSLPTIRKVFGISQIVTASRSRGPASQKSVRIHWFYLLFAIT